MRLSGEILAPHVARTMRKLPRESCRRCGDGHDPDARISSTAAAQATQDRARRRRLPPAFGPSERRRRRLRSRLRGRAHGEAIGFRSLELHSLRAGVQVRGLEHGSKVDAARTDRTTLAPVSTKRPPVLISIRSAPRRSQPADRTHWSRQCAHPPGHKGVSPSLRSRTP